MSTSLIHEVDLHYSLKKNISQKDQRGSLRRSRIEATHLMPFFPRDVYTATSGSNVFRGMHLQKKATNKFYQILKGKITFFLLCCSPKCAAFGTVFNVSLDADSNEGLFVFAGVATGYKTNSEVQILSFMDQEYCAEDEYQINPKSILNEWNDNVIISTKDFTAPDWVDFKEQLLS